MPNISIPDARTRSQTTLKIYPIPNPANRRGATGQPSSDQKPALNLPIFCHSDLDEFPLSSNAFRIAAHIARRLGKNGEAYPSYASMGAVCFRLDYVKPETRERAARAGIKELIEKNVIGKRVNKRANGSHGSNHYFFKPRSEWREEVLPPPQTPSPLEETPRQPAHRKPRGRGYCPTGGITREDTPLEITPIEDAPLEKPTNQYARNETALAPTVVGGLVVSSTISPNGEVSSTADPDPQQTPPVLENDSSANRADEDSPPNTSPASPPAAERDRIVALVKGKGIFANAANAAADKPGCTHAKMRRLIEIWERDCKTQKFTNPGGVLAKRIVLADFSGDAYADEPQRTYAVEIIDPSNPSYAPTYAVDDAQAELPAPLPAAAAIAPALPSSPESDDPVVAHWYDTCKAELINIPELVDSRLVAIDGGGYQIIIADPRDLERVQIGQWAIKRALRGQPFVLNVGSVS